MSIEIIPICTAQLRTAPPIELGQTLTGRRLIAEIIDARLEGERLNATLVGRASADWITVNEQRRIGLIDVRLSVRTDDGANILIQYGGRLHLSPGDGEAPLAYAAPRFETGDPRYKWLTETQAIAKGRTAASLDETVYEIYEVR